MRREDGYKMGICAQLAHAENGLQQIAY